jgi:hypothetical protein
MAMTNPGAAQPPKRTLVRGKLNIAGESHRESDTRRDKEKQFVKGVIDSDNYWTEANFPDLANQFSDRRTKGKKMAGDPAADLMEYRAAHGAAVLLVNYEKMASAAARVTPAPGQTAEDAVAAFLGDPYAELMRIRDRVKGTWRPTTSQDLNKAAKAVYDAVENVDTQFKQGLGKAEADEDKRLEKTRALGRNPSILRGLVPPLERAVGMTASHDRDPATLAQSMRLQRSTFMGLAAGMSGLTGVWKIGNGHIEDLLGGAAKIDLSRANFICKQDFNAQLESWQKGPSGSN